MGVSVRLSIGKFDVVTDTAEEAAELIRLFDPKLSEGVSKPEHVATPRPTLMEWDATKLKAFHALLKDQPLQRRLLNNLHRAGFDGRLKEDLVKGLELDNAKQLAGPFSGLAKNAEKIGMARESVYSMEKVQVGGKRTYRYALSESLSMAVAGLQANQSRRSNGPNDLRDLRDFISERRAALAGFMEQGASLTMKDDEIIVTPRNDIYVRYLNDNRNVIAGLASEHYGRKIRVNFAALPQPRVVEQPELQEETPEEQKEDPWANADEQIEE